MMKRITYIATALLLILTFNLAQAADTPHTSNLWQDFKNYISSIFSHFHKIEKSSYILTVHSIEKEDHHQRVQFGLYKMPGYQPITLNDLEEVHTQKLHLLIIDSSLEDYHHIHPVPTPKPGIYEFVWQPKKQDGYRMWADIVPVDTDEQEFVMADLLPAEKPGIIVDREPIMKSIVDKYKFKLYFENDELQQDNTVMGHVMVTDLQDKPIKDLEPIMGAYAHFVGFYDNFENIVHIHPMGEEPTKPFDRSGPEIIFFMDPEQAGFIKLFMQVKIADKEIVVPFAFVVQPNKTHFKLRFGMESYDKPI